MTQSRNLISPLGPSFMSQVRRHNPDAVGCLNMREILGQDVKQALKTDKFLDTRDRLPETVASDYPSMITDKEPLAPLVLNISENQSLLSVPEPLVCAPAMNSCAWDCILYILSRKRSAMEQLGRVGGHTAMILPMRFN